MYCVCDTEKSPSKNFLIFVGYKKGSLKSFFKKNRKTEPSSVPKIKKENLMK